MSDFEEIVKINRYDLDGECAEQAEHYYAFAEQFANVKAQADKAKTALDYIEGLRELEYRRSPPDGIKITESTIAALLATDNAIMEAKEKLSVILEKQYTLQAALEALNHRKSELDNLTQLWIKSYYTNSTMDTRSAMRANLNKEIENGEV